MDILDALRVVYFPLQDIEMFFRNSPDALKSKKGMELWIGFLLAKGASNQSRSYCAGFPLKAFLGHGQEYQPTLKEIFDHISNLQDTDVDICLAEEGNKRNSLFRLQITRFMGQSMIDLKALLKNKCAIQEDKDLRLIVHIENDFSCTLDDFRDFTRNQKIPYGQIALIGKASYRENKFRRLDIYPKVCEYEVF